MTSEPIVDVVAHAPRYMIRCSACGVVATELQLAEVDAVRNSHVHDRQPDGRTKPHECTSCGTSDEACNKQVQEKGRACCSLCHRVDTHGALRMRGSNGTS